MEFKDLNIKNRYRSADTDMLPSYRTMNIKSIWGFHV